MNLAAYWNSTLDSELLDTAWNSGCLNFGKAVIFLNPRYMIYIKVTAVVHNPLTLGSIINN